MPRIRVTMERDVEPDEHDPNDSTGLTNEAYEALVGNELLGWDDVEVTLLP